MIRGVKTFDRGDHVCIVDTRSGERVVTYVGKGADGKPLGPSLARKVGNFAKAGAKHVAKGSPEATQSAISHRFRVCQDCPLFKPLGEGHGECTHPSCGCSLKAVGVAGKNKLKWADSRCPIDRWGPVAAAPK